MIVIIGRGHSGTRIPAQVLAKSGVFMGGEHMLSRGDMIPTSSMYQLAKLAGSRVFLETSTSWNTQGLHNLPVPQAAYPLLSRYLSPLEKHKEPKGWKLPETLLTLPWLVKMLPEAYYIYWVRNPRDVILGEHLTDNLNRWNVPCPKQGGVLRQRALSWKYQYDLVKKTEEPERWLRVRFEDFILNQEGEIARLEEFLGMGLEQIRVNPVPVGRWQKGNNASKTRFNFLKRPCLKLGYSWE